MAASTTDPNFEAERLAASGTCACILCARPDRYTAWLDSLPDDVEFCHCPGVTWMNRDPTTSRPCRTCGKLRNNDMCMVTAVKDSKRHRREGCRSTDSAHLRHAVWMIESGQLRSADEDTETGQIAS
jgi:hypothetical protein